MNGVSLRVFVLLFVCLVGLGICSADELATVTGLVTDPHGKSVPGATITITNLATSVNVGTTTNDQGIYRLPSLQPGIYRITVSKDGFRGIVQSGVELHVQDVASINFELQIGSVSETVTVNGTGVTINTTDGSVSTVIDRQFVDNIPLNGRSFQDLILLTPGVVTQSPQSVQGMGGNGDFSVNGQRTESNYYTVDGVAANANAGSNGLPGYPGGIPSSTALGTTQSLVSVDALQEFRATTSTYSAEYGRTPGGQFLFVTKSGTDQIHGSVYDYLRNSYFDANNWFNDYYKTPEPGLRQNDFGGTLGGPIRIPGVYDGRNRTFFFVSYEGLRLSQPQPAMLEYVPSISLRQQAPAPLETILNAFPLPTPGRTDYGNGLAEFIQSGSLPSQIDSTSVRIDHALSSTVKLFFRFADSPSSSASRALSVYSPTTSSNETYTLGASVQLSNSVSNEFRLGYTNGSTVTRPIIDSFGGAQPTNLAQALGAGTSEQAAGQFGLTVLGTGFTNIGTATSRNYLRQWNVTDSIAWSLAKHQFKFGFDYRHVAAPFYSASPSAEYIYFGEDQVLSNSAALGLGVVQLSAIPTYVEFSAFGEDQWRVNQRLTLTLGVRWEVNPAPGAVDGKLPYVLNGSITEPSTLSIAPQGTSLWKTTWFNFAPRLGAAWIANDTPGRQTVLRGGGGVFFDTGNQIGSVGYSGLGFTASEVEFGIPAPFPGGINLTPSIAPPYTNTNVFDIYPHLQLPYTLEWSAAVEQQLGQAQTLTITYVGSNGRRLLAEREFSINSQNPEFGSVLQYTNGPTSNYQSLQTKFQRSVTRGFQALASYVWSHCLDYESNNYTLPLTRGNCDFDVRNSFTVGGTWQIPGVHENRVAQAVLNNWALDGHVIARSAFPVTLEGNELTTPVTGSIYFSGVNLVPNEPIYLYGPQFPGGRSINPSAFALPAEGESGNAPRNFVRGFGATQVNLAIRREFPIGENLKLQFRAEAFNILNHPNFGQIDSNFGDTTFGQAVQTLNQSLVTVSPLYQMGGPRSMQFALRLAF